MSARSWVRGADGSGFGLAHLPVGVVVISGRPTPVVRIGDQALDLRACASFDLVPGGPWTDAPDLTGLLGAGRSLWAELRGAVTDLLSTESHTRPPDGALVPLAALPAPLLPVAVGDYVDFYSSLHHATNLGRLFRPEGEALLPNWRHLPIGYHGRAGTIVVSGTPVERPLGQRRPEAGGLPPFGPTQQLDIELEVGFLIGGPPTALGSRISTAQAADHIFGIVLVNDWSARDIQAWEYQPLGPFLGKSFATSISGWVTPLAALAAARVPQPTQDPPVAGYLRTDPEERWGLDVTLEVAVQPAGTQAGRTISRVSFADMYWTMPQQLAHATVNGASVRPGDLFASGTVSGAEGGTEGSLIERTLGGTAPIDLGEGVTRTFLEDGDRVVLSGGCSGPDGEAITLGEVAGTIIPAAPLG